MGAIKLKGFAKEGKLTVAVPEEYNGREVEVTIENLEEKEDNRKFSEMSVEERLTVLEKYKGIAPYPDFPFDKYNVYEQ